MTRRQEGAPHTQIPQDTFLVPADLVRDVAEGRLSIEEVARAAVSRNQRGAARLFLLRGGLEGGRGGTSSKRHRHQG